MDLARDYRFRRYARSFIDIPRWIGWDHLSAFGGNIKGMAKSLFRPVKPNFSETFEEAVIRLELDEEMMEHRKKQLYRFAVFYFICMICTLAYFVFLVTHAYYAASVLALVVAFLFFSFFFRESFWYMQMQQRRLGMTAQDWVVHFFRGFK